MDAEGRVTQEQLPRGFGSTAWKQERAFRASSTLQLFNFSTLNGDIAKPFKATLLITLNSYIYDKEKM